MFYGFDEECLAKAMRRVDPFGGLSCVLRFEAVSFNLEKEKMHSLLLVLV